MRLSGLGPNIKLSGPKPKEIKVETFRIDYLLRTRKVEKLSANKLIDWSRFSGLVSNPGEKV